MRIVWLTYERPPHPDAVCHPADERDVRLVLALLRRPVARRNHIAEQLGNFLREQERLPVFRRASIPCRTDSGLYRPISWRLAKWLARALCAKEAVRERTVSQLRHWLANSDRPEAVDPAEQTGDEKIPPVRATKP